MIVLLILTCLIVNEEPAQDEPTARPPSLEFLNTLATRLGDDAFKEREAAEKRLMEVAKANAQTVHRDLHILLVRTTDPEIVSRLRRVLRTISRTLPIQQVTFTDASLKDRTWQLRDKPKTASFSIRDGVLEIDSMDEVKEGVMFIHHLDKGSKVHRLVLDAEIKILKEKHVREGLAGVHLNIEDGHSSHAMMIQEGRIFAYRNKFEHKMDTTDRWHHYRMVVEGPLQQLFVDDMKKPIIVLRRSGRGRHWVSFGDGTAGAGAHAQIRNVRFSRYKSEASKS